MLGGNVPLVTSLLYVHAALLRMSVTAHEGGDGGASGGTFNDRAAFSITMTAIRGLNVLLAFIYDTTVGSTIIIPRTCIRRHPDGLAGGISRPAMLQHAVPGHSTLLHQLRPQYSSLFRSTLDCFSRARAHMHTGMHAHRHARLSKARHASMSC